MKLSSGAWKTATFKPYNFKALGADQNAGALQPLNKGKSISNALMTLVKTYLLMHENSAPRISEHLLRDGLRRNVHG